MSAARAWTEAEEAVLRAEAPFRCWGAIADMLGRSYVAVQKHANEMGIHRGQKRAEWSAVDIAKLRADYPHRDTQDVADGIGRSASATRAKAFELGLTKDPAFLQSLRERNSRAAASKRSPSAFMQGRAGRFEQERGAWSPTQDAVKFLQRTGPIWRCDADGAFDAEGDYWKFGGRVMGAAAIEARATRAGWVAP